MTYFLIIKNEYFYRIHRFYPTILEYSGSILSWTESNKTHLNNNDNYASPVFGNLDNSQYNFV